MSKLSKYQMPPGGLKPEQVPMFISFGFDDNGYSGKREPNLGTGLDWAVRFFHNLKNPEGKGNAATFDGTRARSSYYFCTFYIDSKNADPADYVKIGWDEAIRVYGNEAGNHTHSHPNGRKFTPEDWGAEIEKCFSLMEKPVPEKISEEDNGTPGTGAGIQRNQVTGFRSPFLSWSPDLYPKVKEYGFQYDCSVVEGMQDDQDGTNFNWPYELEEGHPQSDIIPTTEGVYEMPSYVVIMPPDELCKEYGIEPGFRTRVAEKCEYVNADNGKVQGLDWDMFVEADMTKDECVATLKYTLDLRLKGNRAPMLFCTHSDLYGDTNPFPKSITAQERRDVYTEFFKYALSKEEVRVVAHQDILDWIKNPVAL